MGELAQEAQTAVLTKEGLYTLREYKDESELERFVIKNYRHVFGPRTIYFDIRQTLATKVKMRVADGLLLDLSKPSKPSLWIIEHELSRHDLYRLVEPQLRGFVRALGSEETLSKIRMAMYEEIKSDPSKQRLISESLGESADLYYLIDKALHENIGIAIVIDRATPELQELVDDFSASYSVKVVEFRTFEREGEQIFSFSPLVSEAEVKREVPEKARSWQALLEWTNDATRKLTETIIMKIESEFPKVIHKPQYRWNYFYAKGDEVHPERLFVVLLLGKKKVQVRIAIDPQSLDDPKKISKAYKGWFFRRYERGFYVSSADELDYALKLIRASYEAATSI